MEYIQLKKGTGLKRFGIKKEDGTDTGEYIELDIEDINLPIKANECSLKHVENYNNLKVKIKEANKLENKEAENEIISERQKAILEAFKEFYAEEEKALDGFLGQGATRKLLGGRRPYLTMYDDINEYLAQIVPTMEEAQKNLEEKIKAKYQTEKEDNIL